MVRKLFKSFQKSMIFVLSAILFFCAASKAEAYQKTFQVEDYMAHSTSSAYSGYTGNGYVMMGVNSGTSIRINSANLQAGKYRIWARYAMWSSNNNNQYAAVTVNGSYKGNLEFSPTGAWENWGQASRDVDLSSGGNEIIISKNTSGASVNLDYVYFIKLSDLSYNLVVENGSGDGNYESGTEVFITADPTPYGMVFDEWEVVYGNPQIYNTHDYTTYLEITDSNTKVRATYKIDHFQLQVENGSGDGNYGSGSYVKINADPAPYGQNFDKWVVLEGGSVEIVNIYDQSTILVMPDRDVKIMATYYGSNNRLIVENGSGDGYYASGTEVYIFADSAPSGQVFDRWEIVYGNTYIDNIFEESTMLEMQDNDVKVIAMYKEQDDQEGGNLVRNKSFEDGYPTPAEWIVNNNFSLEFNEQSHGSRSLKMSGSGKVAPAKQMISVKKHTNYRAMVWVKVKRRTKGTILFGVNSDRGSIDQVKIDTDKNDWKRYTLKFNSKRSTRISIQMYASNDFSGTCYFDRVILKEMD